MYLYTFGDIIKSLTAHKSESVTPSGLYFLMKYLHHPEGTSHIYQTSHETTHKVETGDFDDGGLIMGVEESNLKIAVCMLQILLELGEDTIRCDNLL